MVVGAFAVLALLATTKPLHESNLAHRQATDWLRTEKLHGAVLDSHGYTALRSGRKTYRFEGSEWAFGDFALMHVLVERGDLEAPGHRGESLRTALGRAVDACRLFAAPSGRTERDVLVFRAPFGRHQQGELSDAR